MIASRRNLTPQWRAYLVGLFLVGYLLATQVLAESNRTEAAEAEAEVFHLPGFHVHGYRFHQSIDALPIATTTVDGDSINRMAQATLGDALGWEPGVSSSFFGPGVSRPVIRGHEGKRVRILQHGLGAGDDSDSSPDHALSIDPMLIKEATIIRGPAALSYGGSAIGGVVDVKSRAIPDYLPEQRASGVADIRYTSVSDEKLGFISHSARIGDLWAVRLNAVHREAGDMRIPGDARSPYFDAIHGHAGTIAEEPGPHGILENSGYRTRNITIGAARISPAFSTGAALSTFATVYGVPFHAHAHDHSSIDGDISDDPDVTIDLEQWRIDWDSEWREPLPGIRSLHWRLGYTDYTHAEREEAVAITEFDRETIESRAEVTHAPIGGFNGAFGFQVAWQHYSAAGMEVFTPASDSWYGSLFYINEWAARQLRIQSSLRYEFQRIQLSDFPEENRSDDAFAASLGLVIPLTSRWQMHLGIAAVERVPSATELFAAGPHVATQIYKVGDPTIQRERSKGAEWMLTGQFQRLQLSLTAYYQHFDSFIYLQRIGFEIAGLTVYQHVQRRAQFYGAEFDATWTIRDAKQRTQLRLTADFVRATDTDTNLPLPRIPPRRITLRLQEQYDHLQWGLEVRHAFAQNRHQPHIEAPTPSHTLINADASYTFPTRHNRALILYLRANNLLDAEARLHTSFLKEVAPLQGRSLAVGIRWDY